MPAANPEKFKVVKELSRREIVFALARKPRHVAEFSAAVPISRSAKLTWTRPSRSAKSWVVMTSYVTGLALAGTTLVSGGYDGRLIWWNIESHSKVREVDAHRKWIRHVAATPDGNVVASVADDMVCRLWELRVGRLIHELRGHAELTPSHFPSMLFACAISPDGRHAGDRR